LRTTFVAAHPESTSLAAAAALDPLRTALAATASLDTLRLTLAATLGLGLSATVLLDLGPTVTAAVPIGLGRCRCGDRHCRDTCCKDELPHRESPIRSVEKRPCYGAVPPIAGYAERLAAGRLA
jgi:hypothetical protein